MSNELSVGLHELPLTGAAAQARVLEISRPLKVGRMFFMDNLRVFLTILVVLHHLAITYGASGSWFYQERPTTELAGILLSLLTMLDHFYFMGLFFLIAGYFVPGALDRKGPRRFLKDRLVRLGIPLVVYGFLISPFVMYVKGMQEGWWAGSLGQFVITYWRELRFSPGPLWFVEALLIFSMAYVLGRSILNWIQVRWGNYVRPASQRPLTHARILALILVMAPLSFAVRLVFPIDTEWVHFQLSMFPQYIFLFAAGILAYRQNWLPDLPGGVRRRWSVIAILALLSLPLFTVFGGALENPDPFKGGMAWQSLTTSILEAVYCVAMSILLLGIFRQRLDLQGRLSQLLSRNAYTVYIIHPAVLVGLAYALRGFAIDPLLKYALVAPVAVAVCFLASQFLVRRVPLAERVL
ncbi:MAG: acyltransferase family protein [Anaerolineales bacterium]